MQLTRYQLSRLKLLAGTILCYLAFYFAGKFAGIPRYLGHEDSLLQHPQTVSALATVAVTWLICVAAATIITARVRVHAGIFCAALGLMALSIRGGPAGEVLRQADSPAVFILLLLETIVLGGIVALGFGLIHCLIKLKWLDADWDPKRPVDPADARPASIALALAIQTVIMFALVFLLLGSDKKVQSLCGIAIAAYVAAALVRASFTHVKLGYWPCAVPLIVGILGYAIAYFHPAGWQIGVIDVPPARALPLDYASIGVGATCLGAWLGIGTDDATDHVLKKGASLLLRGLVR